MDRQDNKKIWIITHNGAFHMDELMAIAMLKLLFTKSGNKFNIIRTREESVINRYRNQENTFIIDVGKVYDPDNNSFDHHQERVVDTFNVGISTPLSSFGMVYKKFGIELLRNFADENFAEETKLFNKDIEDLYYRMYRKFVESVDKGDNGIKLKNESYTLQNMISVKNVYVDTKQIYFYECLDLCEKTLYDFIYGLIKDKFDYNKNYKKVLNKYKLRNIHNNLIVLDENLQYMGPLKDIDKENDNCIYFIILPNYKKSKWQIHTMKAEDGFTAKVDLVKTHESAKFIHQNRYYGFCNTKEEAIEVAIDSINEYNERKNNNFMNNVKYVLGGALLLTSLMILRKQNYY